MTEVLTAGAAGPRLQTGVRFLIRAGPRTLAESLYLLTAPATAATGLLLVLGGVCAGTAGLLLPVRPPVLARARTLARWSADMERWRIVKVRSLAAGTKPVARRPGQGQAAVAPGPGLWPDVAHAVLVLPIVLVTFVITALWWFIGLAAVTFPLRNAPGPARPMTLYAGIARLTLELASPTWHLAFAIMLGLAMLVTLPLVTRICVAAQAGLGQSLLFDVSALHRRISGLVQERDTARAQTVAAVTAEATALRRLERDIHDGPQQRLVRLAMELGRAQRYFDSKPEAVRQALADAILQTQEALEELRALSRGIAPPILADRGLREALIALAARSTVPVELDVGPLDRPLDSAVETAAYFVIAEALTNVAKHSHAHQCEIGLRRSEESLRAWVTDDGVGGAALDKGHGLSGLSDRLHAAGGQLRVASPRGGPTTITAELPCP